MKLANILFIRAGTLDQPRALPSQAILQTGVPTYGAFYDLGQVWSAESIERLQHVWANFPKGTFDASVSLQNLGKRPFEPKFLYTGAPLATT